MIKKRIDGKKSSKNISRKVKDKDKDPSFLYLVSEKDTNIPEEP